MKLIKKAKNFKTDKRLLIVKATFLTNTSF